MNAFVDSESLEAMTYYQSMFEALNRTQAIIEFDLTGKVLSANENFLDAMGYSLDEIVGRHHSMFCDASYANSPEYSAFWQQLAGGGKYSGEVMRLGKNGCKVWLQTSYNPVLNEKKKISRIAQFATDISANKKRSAEYKAMIDSMERAAAIIEFDTTGAILAANDNFLRTVGYTLGEIKGQHHRIFCDAEFIKSTQYRHFWVDLAKGTYQRGRFKRLGKHGAEVWIQATYNPIYGLTGDVERIVKFAFDITQEVEREISAGKKIDEINQLLTGLTLAVDGISSGSGKTAGQAQFSMKKTEVGRETLKQSSAAIEDIQQSAHEISGILGAITEIANQTNMLAFNAAIEAARAGEHGLGFSVVAEEVRKLAEKSYAAAREISQRIDKMVQRSEQGGKMGGQVEQAFDEIAQAIWETTDSLTSIHAEALEQSNTAHKINGLLTELNAAMKLI